MIQGIFGENDELFFEIELIDSNDQELVVEAMLDTGFSGWLALDSQDVEPFNWIYVQPQKVQTAKGEADFDVYVGKVRIDGEDFDIPVYAGDGVPEVLIGRQWLKSRCLVVDMCEGILTLSKKNVSDM